MTDGARLRPSGFRLRTLRRGSSRGGAAGEVDGAEERESGRRGDGRTREREMGKR